MALAASRRSSGLSACVTRSASAAAALSVRLSWQSARETARRVGVSATAAYRHFTSKEDLLASVAAEGFRELGAAMERATRGVNPLSRAGLAYIEFAQQNRGLFRLMFGPVLAERAKYPASQAPPGVK